MKFDWKDLGDRALNWIITHGPKIIIGFIVLIVGFWLIRVFGRVLRKTMERRSFNPSLRYFLQNLVVVTLQILLLIFGLGLMGVELTFLTAIFAGLTVAAGLALSGTLNNFVSGILILILHPYRVGDNIISQGQEGKVQSIQLFYTIILTYDNKTIIVPNGQLSNNVTINLSREGDRRLDVELKLSYGIEYEDVKRLVDDAVKSVENILHEPKYRVGVTKLEADKYTVEINMWLNADGYRDSSMVIHERIMEKLKQGGIKLPGIS
ncbi:MAG: mechanosensitive ion channel family protein [Chitinophagaceae bacterium]|nr:MAG: mechanosensitive ion channel family protein [Chitinophagaceae bacterium]